MSPCLAVLQAGPRGRADPANPPDEWHSFTLTVIRIWSLTKVMLNKRKGTTHSKAALPLYVCPNKSRHETNGTPILFAPPQAIHHQHLHPRRRPRQYLAASNSNKGEHRTKFKFRAACGPKVRIARSSGGKAEHIHEYGFCALRADGASGVVNTTV